MAFLPFPKQFSQEPGGGLVTAMKGVNSLTESELKNKMQELENQFYPKKTQSEIDYRNALTKGQNISNEYDPEKYRLANEAAKQLYNFNQQMNPEKITLAQRNNALNKQIDPYKIEEERIKAANYEASEKARIDNLKAMANWKNMGGSGGGAGVKELNAISRQISQENPDFTQDQILDARNAYLEGRDTLKDGTPLPPMSGTTRTLVDEAYKRKTDVSQRNQERFANTLETVFRKGDEVAPNAFKFAGAAGKIKGGVSALSAQRGTSDPEYRDYLTFTRQVLPAMASEILRTGGASSTDSQKALAITQANPITYDANPELAMQQYNFLKSLYRDIGKTISRGPAQTHFDLNKNIQRNIQNNTSPTSTNKIINNKSKNINPPPGMVLMEDKEGKYHFVPKENEEKAKKKYKFKKIKG